MNAPQSEHLRLRGASPGESNMSPTSLIWWQQQFSGRFTLFEANRRVIEESSIDLTSLARAWRRNMELSSTAGYLHIAEFPDCQAVDVLVWTTYRAFHLTRPNDIAPAPGRVLCFVNAHDLQEWKRQCLPKGESCSIHFRGCYSSSGEFLPNYIILACGS